MEGLQDQKSALNMVGNAMSTFITYTYVTQEIFMICRPRIKGCRP